VRILGRFNSEKAAEEEKRAERTKRELQERSAQAQQAAADRRYLPSLLGCVADPVPFWPLDPGWVKNQDPNPGWTTRKSYIPELRNKNFWVKILKFFDADPGSGMEKIRIRDGKNPDPG
jgi:hypothetical protein